MEYTALSKSEWRMIFRRWCGMDGGGPLVGLCDWPRDADWGCGFVWKGSWGGRGGRKRFDTRGSGTDGRRVPIQVEITGSRGSGVEDL